MKEYVKKKVREQPYVMQLDSPEEHFAEITEGAKNVTPSSDAELLQMAAATAESSVPADLKPFYGYVPPEPAGEADIYRTAAGLGVGNNLMKMAGFGGATDPEEYVKSRLARLRDYEAAVNAEGMTREQVDPMSATSKQVQAYNAALGAPTPGMSARVAAVVGAPGHGQSLDLEAKRAQARLAEQALENEGRLAAVKAKRSGVVGGTRQSGTASQDAERETAMRLANGDPVIAAALLKDRVAFNQAVAREDNKRKDAWKADLQRNANVLGRLPVAAELKEGVDLTGRQLSQIDEIVSRNPEDLPGIGLWDATAGQVIRKGKEYAGVDNKKDYEAQQLRQLMQLGIVNFRKMVSGAAFSEAERKEYERILMDLKWGTESDLRRGLDVLKQIHSAAKDRLETGFQEETRHLRSRALVAKEKKVLVFDPQTGELGKIPVGEADAAREKGMTVYY